MFSSAMLGAAIGAEGPADMGWRVDGPLLPADWDRLVSVELDGNPADSGATPRPIVAVE